MDGFFRRVWKDYVVDKVTTLKNGMFLIRMKSMEFRDKILTVDRVFFDHKPVMLKAWHTDMDLTKDEIYDIPILVHLDLKFKYWGEKCLEKIIRPISKRKRLDSQTAQRTKLNYARCMIEVSINQHFLDLVRFFNERKEVTVVPLVYVWRLEVCSRCKRIGHAGKGCYAKQPKQRQQWIQKTKHSQPANNNEKIRPRQRDLLLRLTGSL
ncbi:putative UTP--glucose-1-phosphate uridylyltransferase [Bienertia sinuspersici]